MSQRYDIQTRRRFNAPIDTMWEVWTDPNQLAEWWGPKGFKSTVSQFDFCDNGGWEFVMHGPDGTDYPNSIQFLRIEPKKSIRFHHSREPKFDVNVSFDGSSHGRSTWVQFDMQLENRQLVPIIMDYAIFGNEQMMARLETYLATKLGTVVPNPFTDTRWFNCSREIVWGVWTSPDHIKQWMVMDGTSWGQSAMDFRRGGQYHYSTIDPTGREMWGLNHYIDIVPNERLLYINGFSDSDGSFSAHPTANRWPKQVLNTVTFSDENNGTRMMIEWTPINAGTDEIEFFNFSHEGIAQGWTAYFDKVERYLSRLKVGDPNKRFPSSK